MFKIFDVLELTFILAMVIRRDGSFISNRMIKSLHDVLTFGLLVFHIGSNSINQNVSQIFQMNSLYSLVGKLNHLVQNAIFDGHQ